MTWETKSHARFDEMKRRKEKERTGRNWTKGRRLAGALAVDRDSERHGKNAKKRPSTTDANSEI